MKRYRVNFWVADDFDVSKVLENLKDVVELTDFVLVEYATQDDYLSKVNRGCF